MPHTFRLPLDWCDLLKTCYSCHVKKSYSEFHKCSSRKDGCQRACKLCSARISAERNSKNPEVRKKQWASWSAENKDKIKEKDEKYRLENKDHVTAYRKKYYEANKESILAVGAKYRADDPEAQKARCARWAKANPEKCRAKARKRRALKLNAEGSHTIHDIEKMFWLQKGKCANCKSKLKTEGKGVYHIDHIMPLTKGGGDGPDNLQLLCPGCNIKKNAKDPLDWAKENGKLL